MKKLLFLLLIAASSFGQKRFENFNELRAQRGTMASWALVRYGMSMNDKMGGVFYWDSTNVSPDDGKRIIGGWSKGKWIKSDPLTTARGIYTVPNITILQQTITIPHGLSTTPVNVQYSFNRGTPLTLGSSWYADGTNIYIVLAGAALTNLTITWTAYID